MLYKKKCGGYREEETTPAGSQMIGTLSILEVVRSVQQYHDLKISVAAETIAHGISKPNGIADTEAVRDKQPLHRLLHTREFMVLTFA